MRITRRFIKHRSGEWQTLFAPADLHLGSTACDVRQLRADLAEAKERKAHIIIPGDIFDMILPKDHKRYTPGAIISDLRGRDDAINAHVAYAEDVLAPVAEQIDVLGLGNHELACIRYHSVDPVRLLVERLNAHLARDGSEHRIDHGGYTGYLQIVSDIGKHCPYNILYHHGGGGESVVTKGMIDINRKRANWIYHLFLFGHKHHSFADKEPTLSLSGKGRLTAWTSLSVQCGGYRKTYEVDMADDNGEASVVPFEEQSNMAPKPIGGTFVRWRWLLSNGHRLEQRAEV